MNKPKIIDAHAHLNFDAFKDDRADVITRTLAENVWLVNVGTKQKTSKEAVDLARVYKEGVYAIVGLHPVHTEKSFHDVKELGGEGKAFTSGEEVFDFSFYEELARLPEVVGIGECGLDYFHLNPESKAKQKTAFEAQLELSLLVKKPLMLHVRSSQTENAYTDVIDILKNKSKGSTAGNVHFFAGTKEEARAFLDLGFSLSFTGVVTFAKEYEALIDYVPLDRILVETDCPYVTPAPFRGQRNEPLYVLEVAKKIAEVKNVSVEEVGQKTTDNWCSSFGAKLK